MSCPRRRSRSGCAATSACSSSTISAWRSSARSASMRSSIAESRSSSSRAMAPGRSARGGSRRAPARATAGAPRADAGRLLCLTGGERRCHPRRAPRNAAGRGRRPRPARDSRGSARRAHRVRSHAGDFDVRLDQARGGGARLLAPELLREQFRGDDLAGVEEQKREQRTLPIARELNWSAVAPDFERAKNRKLHRRLPQPANVARGPGICCRTSSACARPRGVTFRTVRALHPESWRTLVMKCPREVRSSSVYVNRSIAGRRASGTARDGVGLTVAASALGRATLRPLPGGKDFSCEERSSVSAMRRTA